MKACVTLLFLASVAFAGLPAQAQTAAGIDKIALYNGTWKSSIEHYATKYSRARTESTTLKNTCAKTAGFYACEQNVDGESKALIVFTYDATKDVYHTYPIPADGSPAGGGLLKIEGDTWTFPWSDKDDATLVFFRVVNVFHGPNEIQYRQEYSLDQKTWTLTAKGIEHRVTP